MGAFTNSFQVYPRSPVWSVAMMQVLLPNYLEGARNDIWDRPDQDGRIRQPPTSLGHLLGKSKWEKPLADWITAAGVGLVGQEMVDKEAARVARNDGCRREPFI
jgi:hypothetical protein